MSWRVSMTDKLEQVALAAKWLGGATAALLVHFPPALGTLLAMATLDYITGIAAAGYSGEIDGNKAKRGVWGKIAKISTAIAGYVASASIPPIVIAGSTLPVDVGVVICGWFIVAELISNLQNVARIGLLPDKLKDMIEKLEVNAKSHKD